MQKPIFIAIAMLCALCLHAQEQQNDGRPKQFKKKPAKKERIMININADNLIQTASYFKVNPFNSRGIDIAALYDLVIKKSQFSVALGGAFNSVNIKSDAFPVPYATNDGGSYTLMDTAYFSNVTLRSTKISLNYFDIPFELRWRSKLGTKTNKRASIAIGFKVGFLIQSHTKTRTEEDLIIGGVDHGSRFKTYGIENVNPIKYGITLRAGYANFYLIGYYGLSQVFKNGQGTPANVLSVGIGISPF